MMHSMPACIALSIHCPEASAPAATIVADFQPAQPAWVGMVLAMPAPWPRLQPWTYQELVRDHDKTCLSPHRVGLRHDRGSQRLGRKRSHPADRDVSRNRLVP